VVRTEVASTEPRGTRNPWDRARTPGGSSSGSAAETTPAAVPALLRALQSPHRPQRASAFEGGKRAVSRVIPEIDIWRAASLMFKRYGD